MLQTNLVLFDGPYRDNLLPLTYTRPVAKLRVGITTIEEKWNQYSKNAVSFLVPEYLAGKFPLILKEDNLFINGGIIPNELLIDTLSNLNQGEALYADNDVIAYRAHEVTPDLGVLKAIQYTGSIRRIKNPWDIFGLNDVVLKEDFNQLTQGRSSAEISETNNIIGENNIFLEEGVTCEFATINASEGPVYLGKNSVVMEGALIRGALALCESSQIKMGAKIYGATTIGPHCKVSGEVHNSVLTSYSNKAHDGYLGNAVLGEWCNLGADSNNSNLKNNYDKVKIWSFSEERFINTGLQFCGLIMGDHSKCGINTMFNTGTVVGVSANIFGAGFPRNIIHSFSWGGAGGFMEYKLSKALDTARLVMKRRGIDLSQEDENIFEYIFNNTAKFRKK